MKPEIQPDIRLSNLIAAYPEIRSVFTAHGLGELITKETLEAIGPFLTLETALASHNINIQSFMELLQSACSDIAQQDTTGLDTGLDNLFGHSATPLMTLMPCGLKVPFGRALSEFMETLHSKEDGALNYFVESHLNQELSYYPYVSHIKDLDELPDIIVSSDFNSFFHHRFYNRFVAPGNFINVMADTPSPAFADAGINDPLGQYNILCVNPLIIVADLKAAGDRPLPRQWKDLLDPVWHKSITLRGNERFFCHAVLLPFFKAYGATALKALAHNVRDGQHPSQMVKTAGSGQPSALYVMPNFFAKKIPERRDVKLIWPEDGALASPVTLLVKKSKAQNLKPITDYLAGEELARVFSGAYFPSYNPSVDNNLPLNAKLKWLGWDYIRANDIDRLNAEIDDIFMPAMGRDV